MEPATGHKATETLQLYFIQSHCTTLTEVPMWIRPGRSQAY